GSDPGRRVGVRDGAPLARGGAPDASVPGAPRCPRGAAHPGRRLLRAVPGRQRLCDGGRRAGRATLIPNTTVTAVDNEQGSVRTVETDRGRIETPVVVDAAGAWARQAAAHAGIHIPMVPTRHQLLITEPIDGARPELPIVRIMDAAVCV